MGKRVEDTDGIDALNERAQFLLSIRGETAPNVWRAEWRACQEARQAYFLAQEQLRSNPDPALRQVVVTRLIPSSGKVG